MLKTLPQIRPAAIKQIDRSRELTWLKANRGDYAGQWVALYGESLIASGDKARAVLEKARAEGVERPLLVHIQDEEPFSGGWM